MKNKIKGLLALVLSVLIGQVWAAEEVISINFRSGRGRVEGSAGLVNAGGWLNVASDANGAILQGTVTRLPMWNGSKAITINAGMSYWAKCGWHYETNVTDAFLKGYLDDGGSDGKEGAEITLTGIPFSEYSVIVYCATDTESRKFQAVKINESFYKGVSEEGEIGYAEVVEGHDGDVNTWGSSRGEFAAYGTNALRVNGLSGELTIEGGYSSGGEGPRGGIAAIQIVNTGDLTQYEEIITRDGIEYDYVFRGTEDARWDNLANWYIGKRITDGQETWLEYDGAIVPTADGSNKWGPTLFDGNLIQFEKESDGYKTVKMATEVEGWNLRLTAMNGVHLVINNMEKQQSGDGVTGFIRVDDTSKITIRTYDNGNKGGLKSFYVNAPEGLVFEGPTSGQNISLANVEYLFDEDGSVVYPGLSEQHTIKSVKLDLGNSELQGRKIVSRKLIGFTGGEPTFNANGCVVTTTEEDIEAVSPDVLSKVGDYKFVTLDDGYYVNFVAYSENDELALVSEWSNNTEDSLWVTEGNWSNGLPGVGATTVINITGDTTIKIPDGGVVIGLLTVKGTGTLTITGGKITATKILANVSITANENTLALAPMNIEAGKTVAYTIDTNSEQKVPALTGAGTFAKAGTGRLTMDKDSACDASITVNAGTLRFHEYAYDKTYNIVAKDGAKIQVGTWAGSLTSTSNTLKLEGGAMLQLNNGNAATGAIIKGTIVIDSTAEKPAVIKGNNNGNNGVIAATIKGNGVLEIQDNNDNYFTISGVISDGDAEGDVLAVKVVTDRGVIFTAANTYTGGTVIAEGVTVTVSNLTSIFGTGAITGAGTVKIAGGTYNGLSFAQYTDANTTILIPADNTVTGYFNNATWTCAAKIQLDGALDMTNGFAAGKYTFTGPWAGAGAFSLSNAAPADVVRITGDVSDFTGNISIAGARALTFCAATTGTNQKYAGKICVHGDYAYTAKVNGTWSAPVMVENGAKIGGAGTINNTLTFANGAIIDTSITATGDVTLNGTVTVSGEAGAIVLTCANAESLDLTKFAAPTGLKCVADGNTVKLAAKKTNFVVTVGENAVNCETFAEALTVLGSAGGSLQIAADADEAALAITEPIVITADAVIDLNGKTITGAAYPVIRIQNGANVTIKNGTITNNDYVFVLGASDQTSAGNLTIESGTYTGVTTVASVTKGTLTITGGTFSVSEVDYGATYLLNCVDANYKAGTATIVVTGGTFNGFNPADNAAEGEGTNFCAEGYTATEGQDGYWTVAAIPVSNNVAKIGETEYETLELAFDAAANMTAPVTVTLLKDVGSEEEAAPVVSIPQGFNGTLDLDGKTLYSRIEAPKAMVALTIKNGKILHRTGSAAAIDIKVSGLLTLDDVYLETSYHGVRLRKNAKGVINSGDYRLVATSSSSSYNLLYLSDAPASGDSASLVINGGDFYSRYMGTPYVMIRALIGEVVINDGVFHAILPGTTSQTWCIASETGRPIYINGGDFSEFSKERIFKTGQNASVKEVYYTGGMFSFDPVADATADLHLGQMEAGYHAVMLEGDDFYTVVEKPAIQLTIDLGDGVSKVDYTIAGNTTTITEDTTIDIAESGTVVSFAVVADDGYFAPTVADVTVTETTTVPIAGVAFSAVESADAAITADNRDAVYAWAKSNGKSQSEVSAANYLYADYLFNFTKFSAAEPTIEITEFTADPLVIKAKVTVNGETKIADLSATGLNLNGTLKYKAAPTLEALEDATPKAALDATDRFFKVVVE